jgi:hypothetical protein
VTLPSRRVSGVLNKTPENRTIVLLKKEIGIGLPHFGADPCAHIALKSPRYSAKFV